MNYFILIFASGCGAGYSPLAPGTAGTLVTIPICFVLSAIPSPLYELTLLTFFFLSVWISTLAENYWAKKDEPRIVIDEMMGFLVTMLWIPRTTFFIIIGFFLFRLFDIFKPFPIRHLERRCNGGWGVVLDDVLAGIYSNLCLHIYLLLG